MNLHNKHIAIALRGVVDERTKKLARALASEGAKVRIHAFTFNRENQDGQSFCVKYHDSVEPKGSELSVRVLRIVHNLTIKKIQEKIKLPREGVFGYKQISEVLVSEKPDLIIAINADTLAASALAAHKMGIKYAYETYEFWPDHAKEEACLLTAKQRRFLIESEKRYAAKAALVVSVSEYLADEYQTELHLKRKPEVIFNAPETVSDVISPISRPVKVLFLGNVQRERNVQVLLESVAKVPDITLTFQGRGPMVKKLQSEAKKLEIADRVFFNEPVPYERVVSSASLFDVGVICHEAYNRQMEGALPNKFFEYMAGGLAILAPHTRAFADIDGFKKFGIFIDSTKPASIVEALEYLRDNSNELQNMKNSALSEAQKYCGQVRQKHIVEMYKSVLES